MKNLINKAMRGGSWGVDRDDTITASRSACGPGNRYGYVGFRVVYVPPDANTKSMRGGSWLNYRGYVRAAYRSRNAPDIHYSNSIGFRVVLCMPVNQ